LRDTPRPAPPTKPFDEGLVGIATVVRSCREGLGIAQETFANDNGIDRLLMGTMERAQRNSAFTILRRFPVGFKMTWVDFFDALDVVDRLAVARERLGPSSAAAQIRP
jgi:hypothetical protein